MVGLKYKDFPLDSQMKTIHISIKFIFMFHVNMLQQLYLPVNSVICKHEKNRLKRFNPFDIADNNVNSTFKLKRKRY